MPTLQGLGAPNTSSCPILTGQSRYLIDKDVFAAKPLLFCLQALSADCFWGAFFTGEGFWTRLCA